jgi:carboxypeptidase PM20D1
MANNKAIERFSGAIQIRTVSADDYSQTDFAPFGEFFAYIKQAFPLFFGKAEAEVINTYGLLFRIKGKDPALKPILLLAHYDVVPAGDENGWKYPPFSGKIADGKVWGRGTLDIKSQLTAHLEAAEALIESGFTPECDLYFAYGHDEEVGGQQGAAKIALHLKEKGLRFAGVLDEGGLVVSGGIKGVKSPTALLGVAEKGRTDYIITVKGGGGHASMPPRHTALGQIAEIIRRIEENPLPAKLTTPVLTMLQSVSGEMGAAVKFAAHRPKLFGGLLKRVLAKAPETNAMIRTTFAVTQAEGSGAPNVLPNTARCVVDARLLQGDTKESVRAHLKKLCGDIPAEIETAYSSDATPESPASGDFYIKITESAGEIYPGAIITPYLVCGGTDARNYSLVCENIYRFTPAHLTNAEKDTMHNFNEAIGVDTYINMINFYKNFLRRF